jgi:hypothetical protein
MCWRNTYFTKLDEFFIVGLLRTFKMWTYYILDLRERDSIDYLCAGKWLITSVGIYSIADFHDVNLRATQTQRPLGTGQGPDSNPVATHQQEVWLQSSLHTALSHQVLPWRWPRPLDVRSVFSCIVPSATIKTTSLLRIHHNISTELIFFPFFETGSCYVVQAGPELKSLLPQLLEMGVSLTFSQGWP